MFQVPQSLLSHIFCHCLILLHQSKLCCYNLQRLSSPFHSMHSPLTFDDLVTWSCWSCLHPLLITFHTVCHLQNASCSLWSPSYTTKRAVGSFPSSIPKAWQGLPLSVFFSTPTHTRKHHTHTVMGAVLSGVWGVCAVTHGFLSGGHSITYNLLIS